MPSRPHCLRRRPLRCPPLTIEQILAWADRHQERTGRWPTANDQEVADAPAEKWYNINQSLLVGTRALPGGSSLARLLAEHRGVRNRKALPPLTVEQILTWADSYRARRGRWPNTESGPVPEAPGEVWANIDQALREGSRAQPGGASLSQLLAAHRGAQPDRAPPLTEEQILAWAQAYRERTGRWPTCGYGAFDEAPGETWYAINAALRKGHRGLPGDDSLSALLARRLGANNRGSKPLLTVKQILAWADLHHRRTGSWPTVRSGLVTGAQGETWLRIDTALRAGLRGLRGDSSLAQLLAKRRQVRNPAAPPRLTVEKILAWADAFRERVGAWPTRHSGLIPEAPGETWSIVQAALQTGGRGLPGGDTLHRLLVRTGCK